MVGSSKAAWLAFDFCLEKGRCINPHVERTPGLLSDLDLVGVTPLHLFGALQFDTGSFSGVIHQGTVEVLLIGGNFQFCLAERLEFIAVQERTKLPAVRAIE